MTVKLSKSAREKIEQLEVKRKELAEVIESIKRTDSVKVTETDRKKISKLYDAYINATTVTIPVELTVLLNDDGSIGDVEEERVGNLVDDSLVKQADINNLKRVNNRLNKEIDRLAKKYKTDSGTIRDICC